MERPTKTFCPDRVLSYFRVEWLPLTLVTVSGLVYNIGLLEITGTSILVGSKTYQFIPAYLAAWTIYLVLYWLVSAIFHLIKRQVTYLH